MPTDLYYPGVQTVEKAFQPGAVPGGTVSTLGAFIGRSHQGPLGVTIVRSWAEFSRLFGSNYTDLHNAVNDFYANGGNARRSSASPAAVRSASSHKVYDDTVIGTPGAQTPLFTVTASNPGVWGNELKIVVTTRDPTNKRFDVAIFKYPASEPTFDDEKRNTEWLRRPVDRRHARPGRRSLPLLDRQRPEQRRVGVRHLLRAELQPGHTDREADTPGRPAATTSPAAPTAPTTRPTTPPPPTAGAVAQLNEIDSPLILNLPNMTDGTIVKNAISAAAGQQTMFVVIDPPVNAPPTAAGRVVDVRQDDAGARVRSGPARRASPASTTRGSTCRRSGSAGGRQALHPPGGAVVGAFLSTDATYGAWRSPAGRRWSSPAPAPRSASSPTLT